MKHVILGAGPAGVIAAETLRTDTEFVHLAEQFDAQRLARLVGARDGGDQSGCVVIGQRERFGVGGAGNCGHEAGRQQRA